jgi:hypothetical protein
VNFAATLESYAKKKGVSPFKNTKLRKICPPAIKDQKFNLYKKGPITRIRIETLPKGNGLNINSFIQKPHRTGHVKWLYHASCLDRFKCGKFKYTRDKDIMRVQNERNDHRNP